MIAARLSPGAISESKLKPLACQRGFVVGEAGDVPHPGQLPTKFEMVLNRKAATALGLAIPPSILLRATEVIE